jgi:hypothetical protein
VAELGRDDHDLPALDVRAANGKLGQGSETCWIHRQAILPGAPNTES